MKFSFQSFSGIAVKIIDVISRLPQLNDKNFQTGWCLLQNLPSIICSRILDPQPGEIVLDMCAAPGHKTTHISALMKNKVCRFRKKFIILKSFKNI